jgi:hypothetical protein
LRLKLADAPQNHRFDQTFAAAEVMQNRGMRDAGVGGNFLQPDSLGTSDKQAPLGGLEDRIASGCRASTPPSRERAPSQDGSWN